MPKVSVIIPVYNTEKYLNRCLDSLSRQTFRNFDVICVNDGSTDNSLDILKEYKGNIDLTIIEQQNQGVAKARKNGIKNSNSEYICFIDSDDFVEDRYLEILTSTLELTETNICCSRLAIHFNIPFINKMSFKSKSIKLNKVNLYEQKEYLPQINVVTTCKMFNKNYIRITDKDFKANEDLSINYLNCALANDISFANDVSYHYLPNEFGLVSTCISGYSYENMLNTFGPLSSMKDGFESYNLAEYYSKEIESLFIKNLFQRISYIVSNVKDVKKKNNLISCIISYLEFHYPNWRDNIYYKNNFSTFEITDIANCLKVNLALNGMDLHIIKEDENKILEKYKEFSK